MEVTPETYRQFVKDFSEWEAQLNINKDRFKTKDDHSNAIIPKTFFEMFGYEFDIIDGVLIFSGERSN